MMKLFLVAALFAPFVGALPWSEAPAPDAPKTRLAIIGLDHDHVWGLLGDILKEPTADLVAIADPNPELTAKAKARVPASVKFYDNYGKLLDEAKPEAVIVTTENDRHLEILKQCASRHIHFSTEKPMASNAAEAREMERLANEAHIKGPKEIGVSKEFAAWLYDPAKNGGGAIIDFGCYGAEWALWLKGRPSRVYARTLTIKANQHNAVDDDALIVLEYPDASAIIQASWDWPYDKGQVEVYGPKGSLLATQDKLFYRPPAAPSDKLMPLGKPVDLKPVPHETSNPIAYFLDCIRNGKPIEDPVSAKLNVGVVEVLDAAKESIRTGHPVEFPTR